MRFFWIIFYGFVFFSTFSLESHPISSLQTVFWIIVGLAFGLISDRLFTKNQLSRVSKDYQFSINGKDIVLLIAPLVLFFIFDGLVSWFIDYSFQGLLISFYAWGVSSQLTRVLLFTAFEKKENMRLMQTWWGT